MKNTGNKQERLKIHWVDIDDWRPSEYNSLQILVPYIKILSPRNGIVLDCFGGSGSTLIACEIMKRRCRMIEIEPIYAEVILAKWEKFTVQKVQKISEK
jgi:DNA modification methylase